MAKRTLGTLLTSSTKEFENAIHLTARASVWQGQLQNYHGARFKKEHYTQIVELSFMRAFLTWEGFLEEAFTLYLLGKASPSGFTPVRYVNPKNRQHAAELLAADSRHTDWTAAARVVSRANRFFKDGRPFTSVIRPQTNFLDSMKTIRNALSHESEETTDKFNTIVRNELTFLAPHTTPGSFLATLKPNHTPPTTYLQFYIQNFRMMSEAIVPI
jgi:hypothetical protein